MQPRRLTDLSLLLEKKQLDLFPTMRASGVQLKVTKSFLKHV